jgi:hypothetical protein
MCSIATLSATNRELAMTNLAPTCPAPRSKVIDIYFMEHRAKVIDIAAFLDRLDRSEDDGSGKEDRRILALQQAIKLLLDDKPGRAKRIQELFSDQSELPIEKAPMQGAVGVAPNRDYSG